MTEKFTNRFSDDPFGVNKFTDVYKSFPNVPGPYDASRAGPQAPQSSAAAQPGLLPETAGHSLGTYVAGLKAKQAGAAPPPQVAAVPAPARVAPPAETTPYPGLLGGVQTLGRKPTGAQPPPQEALTLPPEMPEPTPAELFRDEMKLQILRGMFPQHAITPVDYDPFKAVPQGLGKKVNVNEGVG